MIRRIKLVSCAGKRVFLTVSELRNLQQVCANSLFLVSTSAGLRCISDALLLNKGGEILFKIEVRS